MALKNVIVYFVEPTPFPPTKKDANWPDELNGWVEAKRSQTLCEPSDPVPYLYRRLYNASNED